MGKYSENEVWKMAKSFVPDQLEIIKKWNDLNKE